MNNNGLVVSSVIMTGLLLVIVAWQAFGVWRSKVQSGREGDYRALAESSKEAARESADRLAEISESLSDLRARVTRVEAMLKEVE